MFTINRLLIKNVLCWTDQRAVFMKWFFKLLERHIMKRVYNI